MILAACSAPWASAPAPDRAAVTRPGVRAIRATRGDVTGVLILTTELRPKPGATVVSRISGRLERLSVEVGSRVAAGDTLAELDRAGLEVQLVQAQAQLAGAEARLAELQAGNEQDDRAEAEARLRSARARLESIENSPRVEAVPQLAYNLREARRRLAELESNNADALARAGARLTAARSRLDQLLTTSAAAPVDAPVPLNRAEVEQARLDIRRAEEDLARARRPVTSEEVAAAQDLVARAEEELLFARNPVGASDVDAARANVEAAELRLRRAGAPASPTAIKAAESAVDYAWAALELARLQLRESTISAPIAGVIVEVHQPQGVAIAAGTPLLQIQPFEFELVLAVEERQIGQVQVGQGVNIVVDAFPGESFTGTVKGLAPAVDLRTRTVAVKVEVLDPQMKLKTGLFAQAAISGQRRQNVLIVPREAIVGGPDQSVMQVVDGRARRQVVLVGVSDGRNVEIMQGLAEGTEVAVPASGLADGDLIGDR